MAAVIPIHLVPVRRGWKLFMDQEATSQCYVDLGSALDAAITLAGGAPVRIIVGLFPPSTVQAAA